VKFAFNEDQELLRDSARAFLRDHSSGEQVRTAMATELGYDEKVWTRLGAELGWPAVAIPEEYGGLGLGFVELVALLEEMGAALLCSPFFASVVLGANAVLVAGSEEQKAELLPGLAAGEQIATLALAEKKGGWDPCAITTTATEDGGDVVLNGVKTYVPHGHVADWFVVAARTIGSSGDDGLGLYVVPASSHGLQRRQLPTMDQTRPQAEVTLDSVRLPMSARLSAGLSGATAISRVLDLAAIALGAEQLGGAQRCLDMTVQYTKERSQFGRLIGSFQSIKHKLADTMLLVESARSAVYYAAWAASEGEDDLPALASMVKAYCSDAFFHCAGDSIQIHGGVGFTWEYDVHLFFKRAKSSESLLGDAAYHRELVAQRVGI
jgi:alkylation response protein AidB-like acyl-CoA dehydrogenase